MKILKEENRPIEVADLDAVAHFEEDLVLFIASMDPIIPTTLCVQANFDTALFGPVQPLEIYLKTNPYIPIQDEDTQISHRQRMQQEMNPELIIAMLKDFNEKKQLNFENLGMSNENYTGWVLGG